MSNLLLSALVLSSSLHTATIEQTDNPSHAALKDIVNRVKAECHILATSYVATDLLSTTDKKRAQHIYNTSYHNCLKEVLRLLHVDTKNIKFKPKTLNH